MGFCKRFYDLPEKIGNSMTFKHPNIKSTVLKEFQDLEKAMMNFKYFQALQGPAYKDMFNTFIIYITSSSWLLKN